MSQVFASLVLGGLILCGHEVVGNRLYCGVYGPVGSFVSNCVVPQCHQL